jgi:hypothetical protein
MQISEVIVKLKKDPAELFKELAPIQHKLKTDVEIVRLKLHNIGVIMRIANEMAARKRLTEEQTEKLKEFCRGSASLDDLFRIDADI